MSSVVGVVALRKRLEAANERDPREYPVGVYIGDDFVLAAAALFLWFKDSSEMLDTISECEASVYLEPDDPEFQQLANRLAKLRSTARPHDIMSPTLREQMNEALRGYATIQWWGNLQDLVSAGGEFEQRIREDFQESLDTPRSLHQPIDQEHFDEFIDFLQTNGV